MLRALVIAAALLLGIGSTSWAADTPADPFEHLRPLVGKTWRGVGNGEQKVVDISRWEWAVGGKAVRVVHALEDGSYGGETMVFWDGRQQTLIFHYFTTAGFHTQGTMAASPGVWTAEEDVTGHATITKVRSTATFNPDGGFTTQAEYLDAGVWKPGHSFTYAEAPGAVVAMPGTR